MVITKNIKSLLVKPSILAGFMGFLVTIQPLMAQTGGFSYHGFLTDQNGPANADYDLRFTIYDSVSDGVVVDGPVDLGDLGVTNGLFNVELDFDPATFDGGDRWLEIAVRPGASIGDFTNVVPRQKFTAAPYAIRAANYSGPVDASQIVGKIAATNIADGAVTSEMLADPEVLLDGSSLTNLDAGSLATGTIPAERFPAVLPAVGASGLTNLNASSLAMGTIPAERFPSKLPAIDGSQLIGVVGGSGINPLNGRGTNTSLANPSYSGVLNSTNAYPVVRATITEPPNSAQVWQQIYSGDQNAAPFSFVVTAVTNGFNPAVNSPSYYSDKSDVQLHFGYNLSGAPGYNTNLPSWAQGTEMTWFNAYHEPKLEWYQRMRLPNGIETGGAFAYDVGLDSGQVHATIMSTDLSFKNPQLNAYGPWMQISSNTNGTGNQTFGNGTLAFQGILGHTNAYSITRDGSGLIGKQNGNNLLFEAGPNAIFFSAANTGEWLQPVSVVSSGGPALIWNGTSSPARWEQRDNTGVVTPLDPNARSFRTYFISANLGGASNDVLNLGYYQNKDEGLSYAVIEFDIAAGYQGVQRYVIPVTYNDAAVGEWKQCIPIVATPNSAGLMNPFALDAKGGAGSTNYFRLRNIGGGGFAGGITVTTYNRNGGGWTTATSAGPDGTVTGMHRHAALTQNLGKVGIGTNNPQAALDVGNGGQIFSSGFLVRSNAWPGPTLNEGDTWYGSSNGIPHVKYLVDGVTTTVRLVP